MIAAPLAAVGGRRALVILVPVAIVLLVLAAALESDGREPWQRARAMLAVTHGPDHVLCSEATAMLDDMMLALQHRMLPAP